MSTSRPRRSVDSVRWRAVVSVLVVAAATFGMSVSSPTAEAVPQATQVGAVAPIQWAPCSQTTTAKLPADQAPLYSCATYRVPLDHDNAALGTIDIALLRRAAAKAEQKIGSLFLNPGGPGGSGLMMPISGQSYVNQEVLDRFDLIGFDPRGIGASTALRCFTTAQDSLQVMREQVAVPVTAEQISGTLASLRDYGQFCERNAGELLQHMSTKDVVRDLDVLRAAAGDQKLNFIGFSYGTLIGATYANMFPKTARALVIDGNVDPTLRTTDGVQYDRERARGFEIALDGFLGECKKAGPECAFSAGQPKEKFDDIRTHLRGQPVKLPDSTEIDLNKFISGVSGSLYSPSAFRLLAKDLQSLYDVINPPAGQQKKFTAADVSNLVKPPHNGRIDARPDSPYTNDDSYLGVNCSDKKFTNKQEDLPALAAEWERESPTFGRNQAFSDPASCPVWPTKNPDVYRGPWNKATENPVVVVGNYYDPATQYEFSKRMADQLGYSRLLSANAFGHCILGDSAALDKVVSEYLIDLKPPAPGQVFEPDTKPFEVAKP